MDEKVDIEFFDYVVEKKPLSGDYNLLYRIKFSDRVNWGYKVPALGTVGKWDQIAARAMKNEVSTMRLIKQNISIPIPTVHGYDTDTGNKIRCPDILMVFVEGKSLWNVWFGDSLSESEKEEVRARALKEIAEAMFQLGKFRFDQGEAHAFDEDGNAIGVGPMKVIDEAYHPNQISTKGIPYPPMSKT